MRVVLLGPPGAGKGTLAKLLKENFNIAHVSTGDILREEMNKKSKLGKEIKQLVESGALVPDEIVTQIIKNKLSTIKNSQEGFLLDGFPRTEVQAQELDKILKKLNQLIDVALYMESSLPVIIQRLTGRRVCRQCGTPFHIHNKPPKKQGVCDQCGGELYQRPDDNEVTIKKRMAVYLENTAPIIGYYEKQGKLNKVNADQDSPIVKAALMKIFDASGKPSSQA